MELFNNVSTQANESQIAIHVYKDNDGYNVIQIREIYSNQSNIGNSDADVVMRAASNLDRSLSNKSQAAVAPVDLAPGS